MGEVAKTNTTITAGPTRDLDLCTGSGSIPLLLIVKSRKERGRNVLSSSVWVSEWLIQFLCSGKDSIMLPTHCHLGDWPVKPMCGLCPSEVMRFFYSSHLSQTYMIPHVNHNSNKTLPFLLKQIFCMLPICNFFHSIVMALLRWNLCWSCGVPMWYQFSLNSWPFQMIATMYKHIHYSSL